MGWMFLILAGCCEVFGVDSMNRVMKYKNIQSYLRVFVGFVFSLTFLSMAMKTLPMGISYAVWTGIGTVGGTLVGMIFYGESKDYKRILFIGMILVGVIGLKLAA
ncbi:DMT family transporter [Clostridium saccharoperbutylacetonicum]|uniref:DMT family transporter n=1 Tax=Clostridium saccharoperbutylacetonicum TaxID=36745 RepID=UPI000983C127|nr:multidrug efflux SMR transporter [Clostridium saccharoperbutylacetonicum]AQR94826.1 multidrug resistance protein YkkD [Clostridium saccharoperbutylacetonicum]NSB30667.1 paired small multidrug resistance pump [Clostridium saccharoperbutylacetonicum]